MASLSMKIELGPATKSFFNLLADERVPEFIRAEYIEKYQIDSAIERLEKQIKESEPSMISKPPEPLKIMWIGENGGPECPRCHPTLIKAKWWHLKRTVCPNKCELNNPEWPRC